MGANTRMRRFVYLVLASCLLAGCDRAAAPEVLNSRDAADVVLREVGDLVCPDYPDSDNPDFYRHFSTTDTSQTLDCAPAAGHNTTATLRWFSDPSGAQAAFEDRREQGPVEAFHGFPLSAWEEDYPSFPGGRKEYRVWLWQAQQWLVEVRAFDDTHFLIAPDPEAVSEAIYQAGLEHGLFGE